MSDQSSAMQARFVDAEIAGEIERRLTAIEAEEQVRVLYACESGSRAWGFASADSDYDVRFIYLRPSDWYLSIDLEWRPDTIERPIDDELDLAGWDLRKALQLFRKSNPPLLEWLDSPIVYRERGDAIARLRALVPTFYSPRSCGYHYLHMLRNTRRQYLRGERIKTKKYFYALRPLLAVRWLERDLGPVPMAFVRLVDATVDDPALRECIGQLIEAKRAGLETDYGPRIPRIHDFIEREYGRLDDGRFALDDSHPDPAPLDVLFRETIVAMS